MAYFYSEAARGLEEALQCTSIVDQGAVMEKIQSPKSGLNGAFNSLLTSFEVCDVIL